MARDIRLTKIVTRAGDVAYELSSLNFSGYHPKAEWRPDLNAYRYDDRIEICVDLAGVEKEAIQVEVLPTALRISGNRKAPLPNCGSDPERPGQCRQVLAMEIENGRFDRELRLSGVVDPEKVDARHENGLLWIVLPFADAGEYSTANDSPAP